MKDERDGIFRNDSYQKDMIKVIYQWNRLQ